MREYKPEPGILWFFIFMQFELKRKDLRGVL